MMKRTSVLACALLAAACILGGCSTPCEELAEKICACEGTLSARNACERRARQQQDSNPPSDATQDRCEKLLVTCDCNVLDTAAGKRACGLAE